MARLKVVQAVDAWLQARWNSADGEIVKLADNDGMIPSGNSLQVIYPVSDEQQASVGSPGDNFYRITGVFTVIVRTPRGQGLEEVLTLADKVSAIFRGKRLAPHLMCWETNVNTVTGAMARGAHETVMVAVRYKHDLFG